VNLGYIFLIHVVRLFRIFPIVLEFSVAHWIHRKACFMTALRFFPQDPTLEKLQKSYSRSNSLILSLERT